jgi:multidrug efflux system outer membrane protein
MLILIYRGILRSCRACAILLFVSACVEIADFENLDAELPVAFSATPNVMMQRQVDVDWWRQLNDPMVNRLVQTVYTENLTLKIAALRVEEAESLRGTAPSAVSATGSLASSVQRDFQAKTTRMSTTANAGLNWLFDPFGRRAALQEIANNRVIMAKTELATARQFVVASLLNAYVDLRFQQARRADLLAEIDRLRDTISHQQLVVETGDVTEIELLNARAQLAARQTEFPAVEAQIAISLNQVAILAGTAPGTQEIDLSERRSQPLPPAISQAGLPADLLRNRSDLYFLERKYYEAVLNVTQARADLYPQLSIGGTLALDTIGGDGRTATFGPRLQFPAFPLSAARGRISAAEIRVQIAYDEWVEAVLIAISDAEAALLTLEGNANALKSADLNVALSRRSLELTRSALQLGGATLEDVTVAEGRLGQAEATQSKLRQDCARAFIDLQVQLGSGEVLGRTGGRQLSSDTLTLGTFERM